MSQVKVVARYRDGRIVKGSTSDFFPNKDSFHILEEDSGSMVPIVRDQLKALFFVESLDGNPDHVDDHTLEGRSGQGRKIEVEFEDGEKIAGFTMGFSRNRPGFFVFPADPDSNNSRIFIVTKAVRSVEFA